MFIWLCMNASPTSLSETGPEIRVRGIPISSQIWASFIAPAGSWAHPMWAIVFFLISGSFRMSSTPYSPRIPSPNSASGRKVSTTEGE